VAGAEIKAALATLNDTLTASTFVMGERLSVADVSLVCALSACANLGHVDAAAVPAVSRWFLTVTARPAVAGVLGSSELSAVSVNVPPVVTTASGEKWNRCRVRVKELLDQVRRYTLSCPPKLTTHWLLVINPNAEHRTPPYST